MVTSQAVKSGTVMIKDISIVYPGYSLHSTISTKQNLLTILKVFTTQGIDMRACTVFWQ